MIVRVNRIFFHEHCTIGELYINDKFYCYTLEDAVRENKIKKITAIPEGEYELDLRYSPRFSPTYKHDLIWVKNVPNYQFILIHKGNTENETDGCLLVGKKIGIINGKSAIVSSAIAYDEIYPIISKAIKEGRVKIIYKNIKKEIA